MMNGMFPGNHSNSEVAVGNANFSFLFCIFFSLFLKGEELFLPIYSLCVCVCEYFYFESEINKISPLKCKQIFG